MTIMKKISLITLMLLIAVAANAQSTKIKRNYKYKLDLAYKNAIKINPASLFLGNISMSYERVLSEKVSVQLQAGYWVGGTIENTKWSGYSFTPEVRYYFTDHLRPEGAYLAGFGRFQKIETDIKNENSSQISLQRIGGGVAVGYQFVLGSRVTWDTFIGPQYLNNTIHKDGVSSARYGLFTDNVGIRFGTTIGIAFGN
jgi:hypothetical protein